MQVLTGTCNQSCGSCICAAALSTRWAHVVYKLHLHSHTCWCGFVAVGLRRKQPLALSDKDWAKTDGRRGKGVEVDTESDDEVGGEVFTQSWWDWDLSKLSAGKQASMLCSLLDNGWGPANNTLQSYRCNNG